MITVRLFSPDEWQLFRQMRLLALQTDPHVFSSNYEKELLIPQGEWEADLLDPELAIFGVFDTDDVIGMTAIKINHRADPTIETAVLWGSWIKPEYRGRGISFDMYKARIEWSRNHPTVKRIRVSHRASNQPSKRANQKHGFVYTHTVDDVAWPDGATEAQIFYVLDVK